MKILAINGSRRKRGNTGSLIEAVLAPVRRWGAAIEVVTLGDYSIDGCCGCEGCADSWRCVVEDDFAPLVAQLDAADGVVLASPTYWYSVTSDMKRFVDRSYSLIRFPHSRQQWIGKYQGANKVCLTLSVCEQPDPELAGNTLPLLTDFATDIGLEVVDSVLAAGFFAAGSLGASATLLRRAEEAGQKLLARLAG